MRIGVFGGTFDPVHLGHLILAESLREQLQLDKVLFVPAFMNPHKAGRKTSSVKDRLEMLRFAIAGNPHFALSEMEIKRKGPSFTYETLEELKNQHNNDDLFLLIGADSLTDFPNWRQPETILQLAQLVAVNRGREAAVVPESLSSEKVTLLSMPPIDISATEIRKKSATGQSIRYLTPRSVELYIETNQLYADDESAASVV